LRYTLKFKDGRVLQGEVIGEVGTSLLFRDDRSCEGIRVVHIHELMGAWKAGGPKQSEIEESTPPSLVTYNDEFRVLDVEEVDSLLEEEEDLPTKYPPPDTYYEISKDDQRLIFSCENFGLDHEDIEVRLKEGRMDIYFITEKGPRQLAFACRKKWGSGPEISVNELMIEVSVRLGY
jgi:hypothetical protein